MRHTFPIITEQVYRELLSLLGQRGKLVLLVSKKNRKTITEFQVLYPEGGCARVPGVSSNQLHTIYIELAKKGLVVRGVCLLLPVYFVSLLPPQDAWHYSGTGNIVGYGGTFFGNTPLLILSAKEFAHWYTENAFIQYSGYKPFKMRIKKQV